MIQGLHPLLQTLLGSLMTWGVTALGAALCILDSTSIDSKGLLRASLGFSGGVMLSASFWSLLVPAKEISTQLNYGQYACVPLVVGFVFGCAFVYLSDVYFPLEAYLEMVTPRAISKSPTASSAAFLSHEQEDNARRNLVSEAGINLHLRQRKDGSEVSSSSILLADDQKDERTSQTDWLSGRSRHVALMILAITIHNIPEGMAVGVGFGVEGVASSFESARSLAIGIAIQNFPEGLAVSLPLKAAGMSFAKSFWYGQLSGAVEPVAALLGCLVVRVAHPLLPYALSFAAGAMVFVVLDDVVPECNLGSGDKLGSFSFIFGFVVMMILDVALG